MEIFGSAILKEKVESLLKDGEDFLSKALKLSGFTHEDLLTGSNHTQPESGSSVEKVVH